MLEATPAVPHSPFQMHPLETAQAMFLWLVRTSYLIFFEWGMWLRSYTIFLRSDAAATIYFAAHFVWLLFDCGYTIEGGVYFFGKPGDTNDGWIRYVRVRWWRLLDASSTCSLLVLLSAVGTIRTTQTVLALVWWTIIRNYSHTWACAMFTSYYSRAAFILFKSFELCGYYSRAATIRGQRLFKEKR